MPTTICQTARPSDAARDTAAWDSAIVVVPGECRPATEPRHAATAAGSQVATDADLDLVIEQARSRDSQALGVLYQRFSPELYRYFVRNTSDHELAADLTNHVFVRVMEAIDAGHCWHESFPGWLHRIARNLLIDHVRAARRRPRCMLTDDIAAPSEWGADDNDDFVDRLMVAREIWAAVGTLKPEHAELLVLHFADGFSHADVGRMFGKSEGAVKVTLHRAMRSLQAQVAGSAILQACRTGRVGRRVAVRGRQHVAVAVHS